MEESTNAVSFDWIVSGRTQLPNSYETDGVPLSCCLPLVYPAYAKILHRIEGAYQHIEGPLNLDEQDILGFPDCQSFHQFVARKLEERKSSRLFWREIAHEIGLPIDPELNHSWFWRGMGKSQRCLPMYTSGPAEGALQEEELEALADVLSAFTNGKCYFRMSEMALISRNEPLLYKGRIEEAPSFFADKHFQVTPEYWWPEDHAWCVCSDYDLDFTIVAGQSCLIEALLASDILESIVVPPNIRVDHNIPLPHAPVI